MNKLRFLILFLSISMFTNAQEAENNDLKIFVDCNICDTTFLRQNLGNVQFVRDQDLSDVHLFFVTQRNGSGGRLYEVDFIGKNSFEDINYKLEFSTDGNMTRDEVRRLTMEYIKIGLVRFWIANGTLSDVSVAVPGPVLEAEETNIKDPWDYWVFAWERMAFSMDRKIIPRAI